MNGSGKHTGVLRYGNYNCRNKFYSKGPVDKCYINYFFITSEWAEYARVFVPCRPFQHCLMFKGKDRSLPKKVQAAALFKNALANLVNL